MNYGKVVDSSKKWHKWNIELFVINFMAGSWLAAALIIAVVEAT